jgi:hypothetical protein
VTSDLLFLRWDLVEHVAKNLPRTVCLFLPDKQVLAVEMDPMKMNILIPARECRYSAPIFLDGFSCVRRHNFRDILNIDF